MKKWRITYRCKTDGDCCSVWLCANTKDEAKRKAMREYWDIDRIICVERM